MSPSTSRREFLTVAGAGALSLLGPPSLRRTWLPDAFQPPRVAVLLPGIMGSTLSYGAGRNRDVIWSDDVWGIYRRVVKYPEAIYWAKNQDPADAELITRFRLPYWRDRHIWTPLQEELQGHPEFGRTGGVLPVGYDWRQSLVDTSNQLGHLLSERLQEDVSTKPDPTRQREFVFLCHSMGGLLIRTAIGQKLLHVDRIDRLIYFGSPLEGSPKAFRSLYQSGHLPLEGPLRWFSGKNGAVYLEHFLDILQTLPSLYQLLPRKRNKFLYYNDVTRRSPLDADSMIPEEFRTAANLVHALMEKAEQLIRDSEIKSYAIYTSVHRKKKTDLTYRVQEEGRPTPGYRILETIGKTREGDGTVPAWSADGNPNLETAQAVLDVDHDELCAAQDVLELLPNIL